MDPIAIGAFTSAILIFVVVEIVGIRSPAKGDTFTEMFHWLRDRMPAPRFTIPALAAVLGGLAAWGIGHLVFG